MHTLLRCCPPIFCLDHIFCRSQYVQDLLLSTLSNLQIAQHLPSPVELPIDEQDLKAEQEAQSDDTTDDVAASAAVASHLGSANHHQQHHGTQQHGPRGAINSSTKLKNSSATGKPMPSDRGRGRQQTLQQQSVKSRELKSTSMTTSKESPDSTR